MARFADYFGLKKNIVLLLIAIVAIGTGEEMWMRFLPKYLETLGAGVFAIGAFDAIKTLLGAVYAYPGGVAVDHWGHRRALIAFTALSIAGYMIVLMVPRWEAVIGASFLFLAWTCFSLPATFSLIGETLHASNFAMGIGVQSVIKRLPIIIGPLIGGMLIDRFGVVAGLRMAVGVSIILALVAIFTQTKIREKPREAISLQGFRSIAAQFPPSLRRLLLSDILIRFCERIPAAWVVIYAMDHAGLTGTQVGIVTGIEMAVAVACLLPAARLADKYGREPFVIATFIFFSAFPLSLGWATSFGGVAFSFGLRGLKEFGEPARKALIVAACPPALRGRMVGAYYLIRDLIVTVGALIGASLWKIGPRANFVTAALVGLVGTIFYLVSIRRGILTARFAR